METGQDMGGQHVESAAAMFPQHTKIYPDAMAGLSTDDEEVDHYIAETLGGTSRSRKDEDQGTTMSAKQIAGIGRNLPGMISTGDFYKPHTYMPSGLPGTIGAPCLMCGGGPEAPAHNEPKPLPEGQIRVQAIDDKVAGNVIRIEIDNPPTQEARDILMTILPGVLEAWLLKNKDYGDSDELKSLGARAEFVRLWNKMMKLKASLWEGRELEGEQEAEIMGDMIAHLLLALNRAEG
jgi:hypothetical protein